MEEQEIRKYAALMAELGLTGLELTQGENKVRLERNVTAATQEAAAVAAPAPAAPAATPAAAPASSGGLLEVRSPMVGVFYAAPAENAAPYVSVGDRVHKGDVLCIIEAMKLMNEITADQEGIVEEVCVGNNQVVDFDHILFRLRRV